MRRDNQKKPLSRKKTSHGYNQKSHMKILRQRLIPGSSTLPTRRRAKTETNKLVIPDIFRSDTHQNAGRYRPQPIKYLTTKERIAIFERSEDKHTTTQKHGKLTDNFIKQLIGIVQYLSDIDELLFTIFRMPIEKTEIIGFANFLNMQLLSCGQKELNNTLTILFSPMRNVFLALNKLKETGQYNEIFIDKHAPIKATMSFEQAERIISQLSSFVSSVELFFKRIVPSCFALQIMSNNIYNPQFSLEGKIYNYLFFDGKNTEAECLALVGCNEMKRYLQGVFSRISQFIPFLYTRVKSLSEGSRDPRIFEIIEKLRFCLQLGNQYCDDVTRIIDEEKSIEFIVPENGQFNKKLNAWHKQSKPQDILFIFKQEEFQWYAALSTTSNEAKKTNEIELKKIPIGSPYHTALTRNKTKAAKRKTKLLLRSIPLFDAYTPVISKDEIDKRRSMLLWDSSLKAHTKTTSPEVRRRKMSLGRLRSFSGGSKKDMPTRTVIIHGAGILQHMLEVFSKHSKEIEAPDNMSRNPHSF